MLFGIQMMSKETYLINEKLLTIKDIIHKNGLMPMARSTFYIHLKRGKFPLPIKIGKKCYWKKSLIQSFLQNLR